MIKYIAQVWKSILKIGYDPSLTGLDRGRTMLLNGLTAITCVSLVGYCIGFKIIGYQYYLSALYIIPPGLLLLLLNKKKKYKAARYLYAFGSLLVISFWCYEGRRNGNEYILIGVAVTSAIVFNQKGIIYLMNILCIAIFVVYKIYDLTTPFVPDPALNYDILPMLILISTVGVISFQMAFFRDLAHHYDDKLVGKYKELDSAMMLQQATEEELMTSNEELTSSNEQLQLLTNQLETIVRQKSTELESYIEAINVNMFSSITDVNGLFVMVNEPLISTCGFSREELIGKHYDVLAAGCYSEDFFNEREKVIRSGKTWRGEIENKAKDGSSFWFDCVVIPIKGADGFVKYFLSLGLPVTERKLNEQMISKTQSVLETIAFKTSHNIRGPLTRMQGLTNLIQNDLIQEEEYKWVADKLLISSQEIDKVTTELVEFVNTHYDHLQNDNGALIISKPKS